MDILTLSEAKPKIGRLLDRALQGEAIVIRRGNRLVQLREFIVPDPIPERPVGYFRRQADDYADANRVTANHRPLR
jgi:hypothetical protein